MSHEPIRSIVVSGDGMVAWAAAAAVRRRLPMVSVTVARTPGSPAALADRMICTLPSVMNFHRDIRLDDSDVMIRAHSDLRLGTRFEGWGGSQPDYVHAYGEHGASLGAAAFHQHWLRAASAGAAGPFDSYSAAAQIARSGKFAPPERLDQALIGRFGYGLHIDPPVYREMMRAYALHLGASELAGELADVRLGDDNGIACLLMTDGSEVSGDLFIDATGPEARLRRVLGGEWEDWSRWLIADRVAFGEIGSDEPELLDCVTAIPSGWSWTCRSSRHLSVGIVYSSKHVEDPAAPTMLDRAGDALRAEQAVPIRQGRWAEPWHRNCVAIGDAAVAVEPLEWTNLHLALSAIDRVIATMPDRDFSPVELWDYNRRTAAEADRVRDFLVMHYVTSACSRTGFWEEASSVVPPPSLHHSLTQFRERGRLPQYGEETFSRDSWLAVLLGQGVIPRRIDPLVDVVPPEQSERGLVQIQQSISSLVESLPAYSYFLEGLGQRVA